MLKTRRQMRDAIRINLNKRTARQQNPAAGKVGDPATTHPHPSNDLINHCLDNAVAYVNGEAGFSEVVNVTVDVEGTDTDGPQAVPLFTAGTTPDTGNLHRGAINDVKRASWTEEGGSAIPLRAVSRSEVFRDGANTDIQEAGTPSVFWIEGNKLYLYPATDTDGTLTLLCGTGIIGFLTDEDVLEQLPADDHLAIEWIATAFVAGTQQEDAEMQGAEAKYLALGEKKLKTLKKRQSLRAAQAQRTMKVTTRRVQYSRR